MMQPRSFNNEQRYLSRKWQNFLIEISRPVACKSLAEILSEPRDRHVGFNMNLALYWSLDNSEVITFAGEILWSLSLISLHISCDSGDLFTSHFVERKCSVVSLQWSTSSSLMSLCRQIRQTPPYDLKKSLTKTAAKDLTSYCPYEEKSEDIIGIGVLKTCYMTHCVIFIFV